MLHAEILKKLIHESLKKILPRSSITNLSLQPKYFTVVKKFKVIGRVIPSIDHGYLSLLINLYGNKNILCHYFDGSFKAKQYLNSCLKSL